MKISGVEFLISAADIKQCPAGERPEVALAGRSNVGKSSLLNKLVGRRKLARTSRTPGRTQTINFFLVNDSFFLVDLPGYGYARVPKGLRERWGKTVEEYLKGRKQLRGVVQIVDLRHPPTENDLQLFKWLKLQGIPVLVVATKADKLSRGRCIRQAEVVRSDLGLCGLPVLFSAVTGQGVGNLWAEILKWL